MVDMVSTVKTIKGHGKARHRQVADRAVKQTRLVYGHDYNLAPRSAQVRQPASKTLNINHVFDGCERDDDIIVEIKIGGEKIAL
jgi:hypothetical protein